ncbi:two-component sensor histidine kinase [Rhodopirellula maiorica SM1]|uniref:histidine kinase n=1 Tax=Rhodopirellula maiorica SM1 TaxID=1265738 RepID=M5S0X8_9BACT|nr:HAMP domain-containing sensor histidine kinase [Rhodopirellula maiorica]EMI21292.1 two-component sensor histidine kinase [Rhodopirellula maiorica SM1]
MTHRLLIALIVLIAAPLVLLGWGASSLLRRQRETAQQQLNTVLQSRLLEIDQSLAEVLAGHARRISEKLDRPGNPIDKFEQITRHDPVVRQCFFANARGVIVYPPKPVAEDPEAIAIYAALPAIIASNPDLEISEESRSKADTPSTKLQTQVQAAVAKPGGKSTSKNAATTTRWQVWYMDEGSQLILWLLKSNGDSIGVLLERARWVSELIAALPDAKLVAMPESHMKTQFSKQSDSISCTSLVDEAGQIVYRWGNDLETTDDPIVAVPLSPPLSSWQLQYNNAAPLVVQSSSLATILSLSGLAVMLLALGTYVMTSVQRQMHVARSRVSFAGQVSHELRTPLTNIRLYAELAESDLENLPDDDTRETILRRLRVIDSESRRLGRLVSGVLEMVRDERNVRAPSRTTTDVDDVIDQTLAQFSPRFDTLGIEVQRDARVAKRLYVDPDILEMVLVNLLSNVEKYAAAGKFVRVASWIEENELVVTVADRGPGIPRRYHRKIFRPFFRLDDSIHAPSGTGIGLAIAKLAAQRHGGRLLITNVDVGTEFELRVTADQSYSDHT